MARFSELIVPLQLELRAPQQARSQIVGWGPFAAETVNRDVKNAAKIATVIWRGVGFISPTLNKTSHDFNSY